MNGLPAVFERARRPWILPSDASADAIAAVIAKCPSGALRFTRLDGGALETTPEQRTIVPTPCGRLYVHGRVQLQSADGSMSLEETRVALCRCGQSHNKPFCDNSHLDAGFQDRGDLGRSGGRSEAPFEHDASSKVSQQGLVSGHS